MLDQVRVIKQVIAARGMAGKTLSTRLLRHVDYTSIGGFLPNLPWYKIDRSPLRKSVIAPIRPIFHAMKLNMPMLQKS